MNTLNSAFQTPMAISKLHLQTTTMSLLMLKQLKSISKRPVPFCLFVFRYIYRYTFSACVWSTLPSFCFFHFFSDIWKDHKIMEHCLPGIKTNIVIVLNCRYKKTGFSLNLCVSESSLTTLQINDFILLFY